MQLVISELQLPKTKQRPTKQLTDLEQGVEDILRAEKATKRKPEQYFIGSPPRRSVRTR